MSKAPAAVAIGTVVSGILEHAQRQHDTLATIQRAWAALVGKRFAAHTRPTSLRRGRLMVRVDRPGDAFLLRYAHPELPAQLRQCTDGAVSEVVLRPDDAAGKTGAAKPREAPRTHALRH